MDDLTGRVIGRYQVIEEVGRGGMGVVYRAYQPSLNRYVALKVLPPQIGVDRELVDRFQREARAAANLRHPNIVVIHDVDHEQGIYFIVMEYLEGRSLKQILDRESRLHPTRAARIVEQVAAALDYAHQRGFVHRDVKPSNIFVGEGDRVTLTDFGIAKAASETRQLTRDGMLMGTPEYMSPEQATGGVVDNRTDLYALGVVLYQMLIGRPPFLGNVPHVVLHSVIYEPPPPPRQLNPNLSVALEGVILKAMAKQPEQRFQHGAELVRALRRAVSGAPAEMTVPPPPPRPIAPARKRAYLLPWIVAAAGAVLLLAVGLLFSLLDGNGGGDGQPPPPTATATVPLPATSTAPPPSATLAPPASPTPTPVQNGADREGELLARLTWRRENGDPLVVHRAGGPPTLDGSLEEWPGPAYPVDDVVFLPQNWQGPGDHSATAYLMWDENRLYMGLEVRDDAHVQAATGDRLFDGDDVELQVDTDLEGDMADTTLSNDDGQMGFAIQDLASGRYEAHVWRPPALAGNLGIDLAARPVADGYILEAAIPWPALNVAPQPERAYGFCLSLADTDTPGLVDQESMISTCPRREWGDPTTWGTLILVDW